MALALALAACGGDDRPTRPTPTPEPPASTTGSIEATAATTGDDLDPDGYTLTLDGSESQELAPDGSNPTRLTDDPGDDIFPRWRP